MTNPKRTGPKATDPTIRFDAMVDFAGPTPDGFDTPCWLWVGGKKPQGYGVFQTGGLVARKTHNAHRWNYERFVGPIPDGFHIDHLCRVRNCVNPAHLEAVSPKVNNERSDSPTAKNGRKTHCPEGHELTGENLSSYHLKRGERSCRICAAARLRAFRARRRD